MRKKEIYINDDEFKRLRKEGYNQKRIAKALGISESAITRYKKERGIA